MNGLGRCCQCEKESDEVVNIVCVPRRSVEPGNGCWGCVVCGLRPEGAVAVLCDGCLEKLGETGEIMPKFVCLGSPWRNRRMLTESLKQVFEHDMSKHPEALQGLLLVGAPDPSVN